MVQVHERMFIEAQAEYPLVVALNEYEQTEEKTPDDMAVLVSSAIARFLNGLQVADDKLDQLISRTQEEHGLTRGEVVRLLANRVANYGKYMVRYERHGDYDKKADEA